MPKALVRLTVAMRFTTARQSAEVAARAPASDYWPVALHSAVAHACCLQILAAPTLVVVAWAFG
eukprot:9419693-Alexandrium_andersonii.AAC.1